MRGCYVCSWVTGIGVLSAQPAAAEQKLARVEVSPTVTVWMRIWGSSQLPLSHKSCRNYIVFVILLKQSFLK